MDRITAIELRASTRIRQAAKEAGLTASDPLSPLIEALADLPDEIEQRVITIDARLVEFIRATQPSLTVAETRAAGRLAGAIDRLVIQRHRRVSVLVGLMLLGLIVVAFAAGYLCRGGLPDVTCQDDHGGTVCYYWTKPGMQPSVSTQQPPTKPGQAQAK